MTPFPASATGPASSTPWPSSSAAASAPAASAPRLPSHRALAPSAAAHAATFAPCPPAESEIRAGVSAPRASSELVRTTTSSTRSPSETTLIPYDRLMARGDESRQASGRRSRVRSFVIGGVVGASAVAAGLRRARRRRGRPVQAGLAAFESAPCYRELLERDHRDGP